MSVFSSPQTMRARFAELAAAIAKKHEQSEPLRAQRDALIRAHQQQVAVLEGKIEATESGLYEMKMEQAALARSLGGKTAG